MAGVPDRDQGEVVKAWVTLKKGFKVDVDITSDQLKEWCKAKMTVWKCPKIIEFTRLLPVSMTGKVLRRDLQEKDIEKIKKGKEIKG